MEIIRRRSRTGLRPPRTFRPRWTPRSEGDTIYLADHTYLLKGPITVDKAITIKGFSGPDDCVVDGRNDVRCFDINDASLVDLTIQHGFVRGGGLGDPARRYGGGVYTPEIV